MSEEQKPEVKKTLFVCDKYPMLVMVVSADQTHIINNSVMRVPAKKIRFRKTPYGGHFETSDPAEIDYMRNSPQFLDGTIVEFQGDISKIRADAKEDHPVAAGMRGTTAREPEIKAPEPEKAPEKKVAAAAAPSRKF